MFELFFLSKIFLKSLYTSSSVPEGMTFNAGPEPLRPGPGLKSGVQGWGEIGEATARIFQLLRDGEYLDGAGRRCKVRGDVSKITQIIGLTATEKMLLRNYHFMSSRLAGTRQVRRSINHLLFSARVVYGTPTFITVTPSERHSGLAAHLFR